MKVSIMMASGDEDAWVDVDDAITDDSGLLMVVKDEAAVAIYAPGMWMKVEYDRA